jgi:uncharacterized membrane protein
MYLCRGKIRQGWQMSFKTLVTILACDLLFILITIPLVLRKVPPNHVYGFRTRATLTDDYNWYETNAYFCRRFIISSIISGVVVYLLYLYHEFPPEYFMKAGLFCLIAPPLIAIILTLRFSRSLNNRR